MALLKWLKNILYLNFPTTENHIHMATCLLKPAQQEVQFKFWVDDLKTHFKKLDSDFEALTDEHIEGLISQAFSLEEAPTLSIDRLDFTTDEKVAHAYYSFKTAAESPSQLSIRFNPLIDTFPDQINVVNVMLGEGNISRHELNAITPRKVISLN